MPRLFVAIRLPLEVRATLLGAMGGIQGARWQDDDQLHLTLTFLGEVDDRTGEELVERLEGVRGEPFALAIRGVGHFERKGRPSAIWAQVEPSEPLARLQRQVAQAARRAGCPVERRRYQPHVTMARLGSASESPARWLVANSQLTAGPWTVEAFSLFESRLLAGGADYEPLVRFRLST